MTERLFATTARKLQEKSLRMAGLYSSEPVVRADLMFSFGIDDSSPFAPTNKNGWQFPCSLAPARSVELVAAHVASSPTCCRTAPEGKLVASRSKY